MKKMMMMLAAFIFTATVYAQEAPKTEPVKPAQSDQKPVSHSVTMKDGKVWLTKDGVTTLVSSTVTIGGTKVSSDGAVVLKDGSKANLKDGDKLSAEGNIVTAPEKAREPEMKKDY